MYHWPDSAGSAPDPKLRVLVVDDEPTLRLGFAYALSNKSTHVETASSGRQALERLATDTFDVMVLDLRMPELDGVAVIDAARSSGNQIPIILCSAALNPNAALRAIRRGVVDFLLKPVQPMELRQVVEFVTQHGNECFSRAMVAARAGRIHEAIGILEAESTLALRELSWLHLLRSLLNGGVGDDDAELEEQVRSSLPVLAFNSHPLP
jgi:CheY-like chemotaxis protein